MTHPPMQRDEFSGELSEPQRLALASAPRHLHMATACLFLLDARLAGIVARAQEPMLAQMRIAWWRDNLRQPSQQRPRGDPLLDRIGESWGGESGALAALTDGWERLLSGNGAAPDMIDGFAEGRCEAFLGLARIAGELRAEDRIMRAAWRWSVIDLAGHLSDPAEREAAMARADALHKGGIVLPRALRPLAVLDGLARRAIARNTSQLLGDRTSPIAALRLSLFGR